MKLCVFTAILILCLAFTTQDLPVPPDQWNQETHLALARALVGEVNFGNTRVALEEQAAIAFVLVHRWHVRQRLVNKNESFLQTVYAYTSANKPHRRITNRIRWIQSLANPTLDGQILNPIPQPAYWPHTRQTWGNHAPGWVATYQMVGQWYLGNVRNMCPGASHWGGKTIDPPHGNMERVQCLRNFQNRFYKVKKRS